MLRRFAIILVLLSLPLRLWAGVGLMATVTAQGKAVIDLAPMVHATGEHPCHDESAQTPAAEDVLALTDHCQSGDCRICTTCHMPALHVLDLLESGRDLPREWTVRTGLSSYSAPQTALFKPPVS